VAYFSYNVSRLSKTIPLSYVTLCYARFSAVTELLLLRLASDAVVRMFRGRICSVHTIPGCLCLCIIIQMFALAYEYWEHTWQWI